MTDTETNIQAMREEVEAQGGTIVSFGDLPPHIEEEFLRHVLDRPDKGLLKRQELGITELEHRIQLAIDSTKPRTKARRDALAKVRWALRCERGFLAWSDTVGNKYRFVPDILDATIYDGRDNQEVKTSYAQAVTGYVFEIVMERVA